MKYAGQGVCVCGGMGWVGSAESPCVLPGPTLPALLLVHHPGMLMKGYQPLNPTVQGFLCRPCYRDMVDYIIGFNS